MTRRQSISNDQTRQFFLRFLKFFLSPWEIERQPLFFGFSIHNFVFVKIFSNHVSWKCFARYRLATQKFSPPIRWGFQDFGKYFVSDIRVLFMLPHFWCGFTQLLSQARLLSTWFITRPQVQKKSRSLGSLRKGRKRGLGMNVGDLRPSGAG